MDHHFWLHFRHPQKSKRDDTLNFLNWHHHDSTTLNSFVWFHRRDCGFRQSCDTLITTAMSQFISKFGPVVIVSLLIPWTAVHAFVPCQQPQIHSNNRCSSLSHSHSIVRRIPRLLRCQSTDTSSSVQTLTTKSTKSPLQQPPTSDCVEHDPSTPTSSSTSSSSSSSSSSSTVSQVASFGPPPFDLRMKDDDSEERNRWIARLILVTVAAFYGTNFGCVKILNDSLEPSISALR